MITWYFSSFRKAMHSYFFLRGFDFFVVCFAYKYIIQNKRQIFHFLFIFWGEIIQSVIFIFGSGCSASAVTVCWCPVSKQCGFVFDIFRQSVKCWHISSFPHDSCFLIPEMSRRVFCPLHVHACSGPVLFCFVLCFFFFFQ